MATRSCALLGTLVSRLRMKWVRHCCQVAPGRSEARAALIPKWSSEMASLNPDRPRATKPRRKAFQLAPSLLVTTSRPSTSLLPWALTAVAITMAIFTTTRPPSRQR